ncbi:MAG: tyrosine-protein kinase family protein, partial [Nitrospiraceae bacterium]
AVKGEGKSSTLLNLGYVLANDLEKSTLIIDGDLKQPVMHTYAGISQAPGLADYLHGDQPLDRCLRRLDESSLWLLPAGSVRSRHVDLAKMKQITSLLRELRSRFEYILVDAPPILPLADMNVLAGLADLLVMVVRAGVTGRDVVQKALRKLKPTTDTGIILTGAWVDSMPYYLQAYGYTDAGKGRAS